MIVVEKTDIADKNAKSMEKLVALTEWHRGIVDNLQTVDPELELEGTIMIYRQVLDVLADEFGYNKVSQDSEVSKETNN